MNVGKNILPMLALFASPAYASSPAFNYTTGSTVAPSTADSFFQSADPSQARTDYLYSEAAPRPEVVALAQSLGANILSSDDYTAQAYRYVLNNVRTEFRFGLSKGAAGAFADKSGTPFDQADLLYELLLQKGISAHLEFGLATLTGAQFASWTGITSAKAACQLMANGGIPVQVNGGSPASCSSFGSQIVSTISINHIWVVTQSLRMDPSFKPVSFPGETGLASKMGCSGSCGAAAQTALLQGATQASGAVPYAQNLSTSGLDTQIRAFASNLQTSISANQRGAAIEEVTGSPKLLISADVSPGSLSYSYSVKQSWTTIPNVYRTKFIYLFDGVSLTAYADESYGTLVNLWNNCDENTGKRTENIMWYNRPGAGSSAAGGAIPSGAILSFEQLTPSQSNMNLMVSVDHPYPAAAVGGAAGSFGDESITRNLYLKDPSYGGSHPYCSMLPAYLVADTGYAGPGRVKEFRDLEIALSSKSPTWAILSVNGTLGGVVPSIVSIYSQYNAQSSLGSDILSGLSHSYISPHHTFGYLTYVSPGSSFIVSMEGLASITSTDDVFSAGATEASYNALLSGVEGSVPMQLAQSWNGGSSASLFGLANEKGYRFIEARPDNITSALSALSGYSTDQTNFVNSYVNQTSRYSGVLVSSGQLGTFTCPNQPGQAVIWNNTPFMFDRRGDASLADSLAYMSGQYAKGAGTSIGTAPDPLADTRPQAASGQLFKKPAVDMLSGFVRLPFVDQLVDGSGAARLSFGFQYDSAKAAGDPLVFQFGCQAQYGGCLLGSPPNPWESSLEKRMMLGGDGALGLGSAGAFHAASAIAAAKILIDINGGTTTLQSRLTNIFTAEWLGRELANNLLTFRNGFDDRTYIRTASGTGYLNVSNPSSTASYSGAAALRGCAVGLPLWYTPDATLTVISGNGDTDIAQADQGQVSPGISGQPRMVAGNFLVSSSESPDGVKEVRQYIVASTFSYPASLEHKFSALTQVSKSPGSWIKWNYGFNNGVDSSTAGYLTPQSIVTSAGRSILFQNDGDGTGPYETLPSGALLRFNDSGAALWWENGLAFGPMLPTALTVPAYSSTSLLQIQFDGFAKATSVTDANGHTNKYAVTGGYGGQMEYALHSMPDGSVERQTLSKFGAPTRVVDPLGNVTSQVYDGTARLLRTVMPEGNALEYTYDVRGNTLTECQIAKGRVTWSSLPPLTEQAPQCTVAAGDLVTTTAFMEAPTVRADQCTNMKTCNRPSYMIDPKGNRVSYIWSGTHGQLLTQTSGLNAAGACAVAGGACPVTTYGYSSFTGADGATFYLLTSKQETIASGVTTTTTYDYDASNKFVLKSAVVDSDGLALRTCFKFDPAGRLISTTKPLGTVCP